VTVSRIIDGDTFELADGRDVRVLGIDSCEANTPGGREATAAAYALQGGDVILTTEPGVDTDRYDRLLRYVQVGSAGDFGEYMVRYDHTGVYQGHSDASPEYIQRLYAADLDFAANPPSGRECGEPDPPAPPAPDPDVNVDTGDNDDDGGESRFCRRRWWC
jgi:endonuclease YncB( thermonuclease family)